MYSIQILKKGVWPSQAGPISVDETVLCDVLSSYSPDRYRAPLTLTHEFPGDELSIPMAADIAFSEPLPVRKPSFSPSSLREYSAASPLRQLSQGASAQAPILIDPTALAYGAPQQLRRSSDGSVWADFREGAISGAFLRWVKDSQVLAVSPGLYRPTDAGNPTPGKWHLRHIAGLGSQPPAQKGMVPPLAPLRELPSLREYSASLSEEDKGRNGKNHSYICIGTSKHPVTYSADPAGGHSANLSESVTVYKSAYLRGGYCADGIAMDWS